MSTQFDTAFTAIISQWEESVPCENEGCRNPVRWWGDMHGCSQGPICTFHKNRMIAEGAAILAAGGWCARCERSDFSHIDEVYQWVAI